MPITARLLIHRGFGLAKGLKSPHSQSEVLAANVCRPAGNCLAHTHTHSDGLSTELRVCESPLGGQMRTEPVRIRLFGAQGCVSLHRLAGERPVGWRC